MNLPYTYKGERHILNIPDYELNPMKMRFLKPVTTDEEIEVVARQILHELNTSILCSNMQIMNTSYPSYTEKLSLFKYYIKKIYNQILYNELIEDLISLHVKNIEFDKKFKEEHKEIPKVKNKSNKKKLPLWIRQISKDMFDGETVYIYTNTKTNEIIQSHNPNLIEEELSKKKTKKPKQQKVISGNITFSFKMK